MAYVKIPFFTARLRFVDSEGRLDPAAQTALNNAFANLGNAINVIAAIPEIQAALVALDAATQAAQTAANNANAAASATRSESSLVNSFVKNPSNPISANSTGVVFIADHQRQYGDPTLNPTVSVTGGSLTTGATPGQTVRVYYDQPSRAGGAVTYQFTVDPAAAPVQSGNRHSVGAVEIPATGTQDGKGLQPPGYVIIN